ncbi:uncharacterized protein [Muntiacus reevesi]|uniref:uncharacterized protein n=1 Tax=Muntiacus reevesi TaxID=9886 RepID=UPI00330762A1
MRMLPRPPQPRPCPALGSRPAPSETRKQNPRRVKAVGAFAALPPEGARAAFVGSHLTSHVSGRSRKGRVLQYKMAASCVAKDEAMCNKQYLSSFPSHDPRAIAILPSVSVKFTAPGTSSSRGGQEAAETRTGPCLLSAAEPEGACFLVACTLEEAASVDVQPPDLAPPLGALCNTPAPPRGTRTWGMRQPPGGSGLEVSHFSKTRLHLETARKPERQRLLVTVWGRRVLPESL